MSYPKGSEPNLAHETEYRSNLLNYRLVYVNLDLVLLNYRLVYVNLDLVRVL